MINPPKKLLTPFSAQDICAHCLATPYEMPVEEGEVVTPGLPLISLVDLSDTSLGFWLREDLIAAFKVGDRFTVGVPVLGNREVTQRPA